MALVWITNKYNNAIKHRELADWEEKPKSTFWQSHMVFETWEEARDQVVRNGEDRVKRIAEDLKKSRADLRRAKSMKKPEGA